MKLKFGVLDAPYADKNGTTTGQVAVWLEDKYGVMGAFYGSHADYVAGQLEGALKGTIDNLLMGAPGQNNPYGGAESAIETKFRDWLDQGGPRAAGVPGTPTQAAQAGKSVRFKRGRGPARPDFINSGLYQANMRFWVD